MRRARKQYIAAQQRCEASRNIRIPDFSRSTDGDGATAARSRIATEGGEWLEPSKGARQEKQRSQLYWLK
jgi:hypothetical protein